MTRLVLVALDLDKKFRVKADASNYATGEVLLVKCSNRMQRPGAFISKSLSNTERNYKIHDKKILVVVRYLEAQRHFLEGTTTKFKIWTNYKNLEYFIKVQKLNRKQAKQTLYLSRFNFTLKHILGNKMEKVDSLSKRPDQKVGVERDNENKILVKLEQLEVKKTGGIEVIIERVNLLEKVKHSRVKDNKMIKAMEEIKQTRVKMLRNGKQKEINGIIYKKRKVYVPKNKKSRVEIIRLCYNIPLGEYGGNRKQQNLSQETFSGQK